MLETAVMTAPWSRRGFLTASAGTAVALGLDSRAFAAADEFPTLCASLTLAFGDLTAAAGATQRVTVRPE